MFSSSARRAALTVPSQPLTSPLSHIAPRAPTTTKALSSQCHQRRYSSSKPSSPPADGPKGVAEAVPGAPAQARPEAEKKSKASRKRASKDDGNAGSKGRHESLQNLPSVPSTQHISPTHISASDFFSLYRPISLTSSFPKPISAHTFASIFTPRTKSNNPNKTSEVISTLTSALERFDSLSGSMKKVKLDNQQQTQQQQPQWNETTDTLRAAITAESYRKADVKHLDGVNEEVSIITLPAHVLSTQHFRPFQPPPPPVPQPDFPAFNSSTEVEASEEPQHRTYTAVLTISESTDANGEITYTTHSTPLMVQDPPSEPVRYIERLRRRGEGMWAISVKRQRKLKMKKHKYKKLMKRTRVLRRKLDRT